MAVTLPDINALGRRPVPMGNRGFAQQDTAAPGMALAQAGREVGRDVMAVVDEQQKNQDIQDVLAARRQLDDWERLAREKAQERHQKDAFGVPDEMAKGFDEAAGKIGGDFKSRRAAAAFQEMATARRASVLDWAGQYAQKERQVYNLNEFKANVDRFQQNAANDAQRAPIELDLMQAEIRRFGRSQGLGEADLALQVSAATDALNAGVVRSYLIQEKPTEAAAYFDKVKDTMDVKTRGSLRAEVGKVADAIEANDFVVKTVAEMGPRAGLLGVNDPFMLKDMEDKARAKYAGKPDQLAAVMSSLRQMYTAHNQQQQEVNAGLANQVMGFYNNGAKTESQVRKLPAFMAMAESQQSKIVEAIRNDVHSANVRATSGAAREEQAIRLAEARRDRAMSGVYLNVRDPEVLAGMSTPQVQALLPTLGPQRTEHLLALHSTLQTAEGKLAAKVDNDMFRRLAVEAKYDVSPPKDSRAERSLIQLRDAVDQGVIALQRDQKKQATPEQVREVMQKIIDDKVMESVNWGRDQTTPAAMLGRDAQATAYVMVDGKEILLSEIKPTDETRIRALLKRNGVAATWQNVATQYEFERKKQRSSSGVVTNGQ